MRSKVISFDPYSKTIWYFERIWGKEGAEILNAII